MGCRKPLFRCRYPVPGRRPEPFQKSAVGRAAGALGLDWTGSPTVWEAMLAAAILIRDLPTLAPEAQRTLAVACAAQHGLAIGRIYADDGRRPRHARQAVARGEGYDVLVVATTTALGQTLNEVVALLTVLAAKGVRVLIADGGDDAGAMLAAAVPTLAAAQAALRREAVLRGREKAKARGVRFGRPPLPEEKLIKARTALAAGAGIRAAARIARISPAAVMRLAAEARSKADNPQ